MQRSVEEESAEEDQKKVSFVESKRSLPPTPNHLQEHPQSIYFGQASSGSKRKRDSPAITLTEEQVKDTQLAFNCFDPERTGTCTFSGIHALTVK